MILERNGRVWTNREDQIALKYGPQIAAERLGRSVKSVYTRLALLRGRRSKAWLDSRRPKPPEQMVSVCSPSIAALLERDTAMNGGPRDLTAAIMGDPLPGRSAYERSIDRWIQQGADENA